MKVKVQAWDDVLSTLTWDFEIKLNMKRCETMRLIKSQHTAKIIALRYQVDLNYCKLILQNMKTCNNVTNRLLPFFTAFSLLLYVFDSDWKDPRE